MSSFLYDEPNFLLQKEVSEVGSYFSVIKAIAAGNQKLAKIAGMLELKQTGLTKYLKNLIDLDILEREDNFILFWFKFIYPNLSFIESGNSEFVMKKIKSNFIDNHVSYVYEDICMEEMWKLNAEGKWKFTFDRVGRWWNNTAEINIVALDSTGNNVIFGECKYWESKVGINVLTDLEGKAKSVEWKKGERNEYFILFAVNGFTDELTEYIKERNDVLLWN